ncbi:MAG TPA: tetratricopeptide repeat protein [Saprospiraceae bacterium]|nr:tetratricopeptide repeat protein [Saprospiraceae bacterium]
MERIPFYIFRSFPFLFFWTLLPFFISAQAGDFESRLERARGEEKISILIEGMDSSEAKNEYDKVREYGLQLISVHPEIEKDRKRIKSLKSLSRAYRSLENRDSAIIFCEKYLRGVQNYSDLPEQAWAHNYLGILFYESAQFREALFNFQESLSIKQLLNDEDGLSSTYNNLGNLYRDQGDFPKAIEAYEKSLEIKEKLGSPPGRLAVSQYNLGEFYRDRHLDYQALEYYFLALKNYEDSNDSLGIANVLNVLGIMAVKQKDVQQAFEYYSKSKEIAEQIGHHGLLPYLYMNLAEVYQIQGEKQRNIDLLNQGLTMVKESGLPNLIGDFNINLGISFADQGNYSKALEYLFQADTMYAMVPNVLGQANANVEIGRTLSLDKKYRSALGYLNKGLEVSRQKGDWQIQRAALKNLSEAYHFLNISDKAYQYLKSYNVLNESHDETQETDKLGMLKTLIKLKQDKIKSDLQVIAQRRAKNNIIGFSLLFLLVLLGSYLIYRLQQHQKQIKYEKQKALQLQKIDELKDQFLANTSHELRTPLNGIIGLSDSLIEGACGNLSEQTVDNLRLISSSGKRLSNLVNDILDFSKARNQDLKLQIQPVDLYVIADLVIKSSEVLIGTKPVRIENSIARDIPLVKGDENRLQQILFNFVGNAIKFTDQGKITVTAEVKDKQVEIRVEDTGIGIPEDKIDAIFKSFEQLDGSDTRLQGGTGLGLAVTKQLVELHGSTIEVKSSPGKGSTFSFRLPVSQTSRDSSASKSPPAGAALIPAALPRPGDGKELQKKTSETLTRIKEAPATILLVDDEPVNLRVLENHLVLRGFEVDKALNAFDALEKLKQRHFDLVILDVMMPTMSGFELCEKIRERHLANKLPVIMLTAKNTISDLLRGFEVGVNDYLTKPFSIDELMSRIRTHLHLKNFYQASDKFVPIEFLKAIGRESITDAKIGDYTNARFTILFSDIRNYTTLSETLSPEENFNFINAYVGRMGPYIKKYKGFVNQYLGDAIMAIYPDEVEYALDSAIEMQHAIQVYNRERKKKGRDEMEAGMGLHNGALIMGIIGDENRADPTTLADTVNIASRMEGLTKYFGVRVLISEDVMKQIKDPSRYQFRCLGKILVKGKSKALTMYECLNADPEPVRKLKMDSLWIFDHGITSFQSGDFIQAVRDFEQVLFSNPSDSVAQYFLKKSMKYQGSGGPKNWDGIEVMAQK